MCVLTLSIMYATAIYWAAMTYPVLISYKSLNMQTSLLTCNYTYQWIKTFEFDILCFTLGTGNLKSKD